MKLFTSIRGILININLFNVRINIDYEWWGVTFYDGVSLWKRMIN